MPDSPNASRVLTDADFVESARYGPPPLKPGACLLIVAHTNLYGTKAEDDDDVWGARAFVQTLLTVAPEFPEIEVGLLNHNDAPDTFRRFRIESRPPYAEALIWLRSEWRRLECIDTETPDSVRLWLRGILLVAGFRPTYTREDLVARLAYELAQPEKWDFDDARWDVPDFRFKVYEAAKSAVERLANRWAERSP